MDLKCLPISINLPSKYLSIQPFGLGKGVNNNIFYFIKTVIHLFIHFCYNISIKIIKKRAFLNFFLYYLYIYFFIFSSVDLKSFGLMVKNPYLH